MKRGIDIENQQKFDRAKKRVTRIRKFYNHVLVFILVNSFVLIGRFYIIKEYSIFEGKDQGFINWFNLNTLGTTVLWLIVLGFQGLWVYGKLRPFKSWEEKKIKEIIEQENEA